MQMTCFSYVFRLGVCSGSGRDPQKVSDKEIKCHKVEEAIRKSWIEDHLQDVSEYSKPEDSFDFQLSEPYNERAEQRRQRWQNWATLDRRTVG